MSKSPIQVLDKKDLNDSFHVIGKPFKNSPKSDLRQAFKTLSVREFLIYCAFTQYTCREVARHFKKSHEKIRDVYVRACRKIEAEKRRKK